MDFEKFYADLEVKKFMSANLRENRVLKIRGRICEILHALNLRYNVMLRNRGATKLQLSNVYSMRNQMNLSK